LPGSAAATAGFDIDGIPYGRGRADIRLGVDSEGELYVLSKSDGMLRRLLGAPSPDLVSISVTNGLVSLSWRSIPAHNYRLQSRTSMVSGTWTDVPGDVIAAGQIASKNVAATAAFSFYRVSMLP